MSKCSDLWVFGYGSIVWRPAFEFAERRPALVRGHARRFWQGSTDHRGTPEAPGRVVTLVPDAPASCSGVAYRLHGAQIDSVLERLDRRESGGYTRCSLELSLLGRGASDEPVRALSYVALPDNPNYLGPAPLADIAHQVRTRTGPSGSNLEYVLRLVHALAELEPPDRELIELAALLRESGDHSSR